MTINREELRKLHAEAFPPVPAKRPPYGDTDPRFDLETGRVILANLEHDDATQQNQDTLFVELRMACQEIERLQPLAFAIPALLDEIDAKDRRIAELENSLVDMLKIASLGSGPVSPASAEHIRRAGELLYRAVTDKEAEMSYTRRLDEANRRVAELEKRQAELLAALMDVRHQMLSWRTPGGPQAMDRLLVANILAGIEQALEHRP